MNKTFCIKPILAVLYILPPKSVGSINPQFIKEILSIGNRRLPLLKLVSNLIGSCSAYFEYQVEMEIAHSCYFENLNHNNPKIHHFQLVLNP